MIRELFTLFGISEPLKFGACPVIAATARLATPIEARLAINWAA
jgi:hypothetical protein